VKAARDFTRFKHQFLLPEFACTVKAEGLLTAGRSFIKMGTVRHGAAGSNPSTKEDIMSVRRAFASSAIAAILGILLCFVLAAPAVAQDGKQIYNNRCALCHGADGDGKGVIMQIAPFGADFWKASDDAAISKAIVEGKGRMPAIPLSSEETKAVVEYMKANFKK